MTARIGRFLECTGAEVEEDECRHFDVAAHRRSALPIDWPGAFIRVLPLGLCDAKGK